MRPFPLVPGIDFAGEVSSRAIPASPRGGGGVPARASVRRLWGGLAERGRVPAEWLLPRPSGLRSAGHGDRDRRLHRDAGLLALEEHGVRPGRGRSWSPAPGVGSVARDPAPGEPSRLRGPTPSTGRAELHGWLGGLGARRLELRPRRAERAGRGAGRRALVRRRRRGRRPDAGQPARPGRLRRRDRLLRPRRRQRPAGDDLPLDPEVALLGIGSAQTPPAPRARQRLARDLPREVLPTIARTCSRCRARPSSRASSSPDARTPGDRHRRVKRRCSP